MWPLLKVLLRLTRDMFALFRTTVGQHFDWYKVSRESLGDSWASCLNNWVKMNRFLPPSPHDCQISVLLLLRLMTAAAKMKENQTSVEKICAIRGVCCCCISWVLTPTAWSIDACFDRKQVYLTAADTSVSLGLYILGLVMAVENHEGMAWIGHIRRIVVIHWEHIVTSRTQPLMTSLVMQ